MAARYPTTRDEALPALLDRGELQGHTEDGWEIRSVCDPRGHERRFLERAKPGFEDEGCYERVYLDTRSEIRALDADGLLLRP